MILEHSSYRQYLKGVLSVRAERNPRYSLRSFAKNIGLTPALVSEILSGKKNLSAEKSITVGKKLGLKDAEFEYFHLLVQFENSKSTDLRGQLQKQIGFVNPQREVSDLSAEAFKLLSNWQHFAVLMLGELGHFKFTDENVAAKLHMSVEAVRQVVARLKQLNLIDIKQAKMTRTAEDLEFKTPDKNLALRSYNRQILQKAAESLENQPPEDKVFATEIVAVPKSVLPKIQRLSNEYLDKVLEAIRQDENEKTEIYCVGVNVFNLSQKGIK